MEGKEKGPIKINRRRGMPGEGKSREKRSARVEKGEKHAYYGVKNERGRSEFPPTENQG